MQGLSGQAHSGEESGGGGGDAPIPRDSSYSGKTKDTAGVLAGRKL